MEEMGVLLMTPADLLDAVRNCEVIALGAVAAVTLALHPQLC
jgi:hypothetical protein